MSTRHVVHEILMPGLDGDGFTAAEAAQIRDEIENYGEAVGRIDPGDSGPVGATLRRGPSGPTWASDAIKADWFSDPQDAIDLAGPGQQVVFSKDVIYWIDETLRVTTGTQLIGESRETTILRANTSESVICSANATTENVRSVYVSNMTLDGFWRVDTVADAREMTQCAFDRIRVIGAEMYGIWFGGDHGNGGWSNSLMRSQVTGPVRGVGAGVYLHGRIGRTGAMTANNNTFVGNIIYSSPGSTANTSRAIDIEEGGENHFFGNDLGYSNATAISLGYLGQNNSFVSNRCEDSAQAVFIEDGVANRFISNSFHIRDGATDYPAKITGTAERNIFAWNNFQNSSINPSVFEEPDARGKNTIIALNGESSLPGGATNHTTTYRALTSRSPGDTYPRYFLAGDGSMGFGDGSATPNKYFGLHASGAVGTLGDTDLKAGGGGWSNGHVVMGGYHLWVDTSGRLRIKAGAPTSSTDGAVVGGQS